MKAWYYSKDQQEQRIILILAIIIGLSLFYLLIWSPISEAFQQKNNQVNTKRELLTWMQKTGQEISSLKPRTKQKKRNIGSLLSTVDRTIKASGLSQTMKRLEPQRNDSVQIWFEKTSFDTLIKWLGKVNSEYTIMIQSINIDRLEQPGIVNARLILKKG
ncbi:MAG: type II secretion system protein M [Gammaproteobacteria bacterium]|nr:type II secretion system protein M [Gammaproteobacteria bacterium]